MERFGRRRGGPLALAALLLVAAADQPAPRAVPSPDLVAVFESSPLVVRGEVAATQRLDRHGFAGTLLVETALVGEVERGGTLHFAWEELAVSRAPRLAPGERVLLALEPLPSASLWADRIPDPEARARTLAVAARGEGFLRSPAPAEVALLEHYLALWPEDRRGPVGADHLATLAARAEPALAGAALRRLAALTDPGRALDARSGAQVVAALERPEEVVRREAADFVASRKPEPLRPLLLARAAEAPLAPPQLYEALAGLAGGLREDLQTRLAEAGSEEHRQVAVRFAEGPDVSRRLIRLLRHDAAPAVRSAALRRLVEIEGAAALEPALVGLDDRDPSVRLVAAQVLGGLGEPAVSRLREVALAWPRPASEGAVMALGLVRAPKGTEALEAVAEEHPDEALRRLAELALRRPVDHPH